MTDQLPAARGQTNIAPTVEYTVEDRIAYIVLNRPDRMNAVNAEMRTELWHVFNDVRDNAAVWAAIITGRGKAFSSGHDLTETFADAKPSFDELYSIQTQIYKPMICAVNGICLAQGAAIALASDICLASERASFGWPQVKRGVSSISGPTMLARRVPINKAFELLFTGDLLTGQEALALHMINYVVPHEELMPAAERLARRILENAPLAVWAMKEATLRTLSMVSEDAYRFASQLLRRVEATEDAQEGLRAFREKRRPIWKAR